MILARQEQNKLTLNIHTAIDSWSWYDEDEKEENSVANVRELEKIMEANKNVSLIDVYINSPGGDVFEGIGIYNILKRSKAYKRIYIDGFACSIASVIAMAGNAIYMPKSSLMMIHNCWTYVCGNANDLRKAADDMDKMNDLGVMAYMTRFNGEEKALRKMLDEETYLTADECLSYGFCTKVIDDGEETEIMVNEGLDKQTNLYSAKLEQLRSIKESFANLNVETTVSDAVNEATNVVETAVDETAVNETFGEMETLSTTIEHSIEEAQKAVEAQAKNALHAFFHI